MSYISLTESKYVPIIYDNTSTEKIMTLRHFNSIVQNNVDQLIKELQWFINGKRVFRISERLGLDYRALAFSLVFYDVVFLRGFHDTVPI